MRNSWKKHWRNIIGTGLITVGIGSAFCSLSMAQEFNQPSVSQVPVEFMPVKNGQLEYYRFGQGSPIVLIGGFGTTVSNWNREFLTTLSQHHEVIIFNNRNVGASIIRSNRYTTRDLANDTLQLIQGLNLYKPSVLGFSMGGMVAQQLAILYPDKISHLILLNTAIAGSESVSPEQYVKDVMFNPPANVLKRDIEVLKVVSPPGWRIRTALGLKFDQFKPFNHRESLPTTTTLHQQYKLIVDWSKNDEAAKKLSHLSIPALILSGGSDQVLPPGNSDMLAKTIPHATLLRWDNGGHSMIFQHPRAIARAITNFVDDTRV